MFSHIREILTGKDLDYLKSIKFHDFVIFDKFCEI